jgi:STE24 endopeptidase
MQVPPLLALLLVASLLETCVSLWLARRQIAHVRRHRERLPADFAASVTAEEHRKAADYTITHERLDMVKSVGGWTIGAAWLLGGFDLLYGGLALITPPSLVRSIAFMLATGVIGTLLTLPAAIYETFGIERKFGFNRTTPAMFVIDRLKGCAISAIIGIPLLAGLFWLMRHATGLWWLYVWFGVVVLMACAPAVYVGVIAPRFNKFTPLPEGELRAAITALMRECGFRASSLFTMDASKRSTHGNAYFIGFGRSKRIVLFDTLIDGSPISEVRAIIAHELGHFRHRHVLYGLVRSAVTIFIALAAFGWLARQPWLLPSLGITHTDNALSLTACVLCWGLIGPFGALVGNWISRKNEFQADDFAREHAGADPMVSALVRLSRDNASTLTPDPVYALYHYSHPPVPVRVARIRERARSEGSPSLVGAG